MGPQMVGLTAQLIDQVRAIGRTPLPDDVLAIAKNCALDWFAVAIGGSREPLVGILVEEAREQGGHPVCTLIATGEKTSPAQAALINGATADALDFSDSNLAMRGHTTPAVVATALALAQARNATGRQFLNAIVVGVETACRVGLLANPPLLRRGFHPTGNIAPFGATAAAADIFGLDAECFDHALGIAATQAAGLLASGGTMSKPLHSGKAAMNGLMAADLARRGFVGRRGVLEAPEGFLATHADKASAEARGEDVLDACRTRYFMRETKFKSHAACQLTHSTIENMLLFRRDHDVRPADIDRIELRVPTPFLSVCNIQEPVTALEAKFSLRAVAAMALLGDDTRDVAAYAAERVTRPELCNLRDRMTVTPQDSLAGGVAIAVARLTDGRQLSATSDSYAPLGDLPSQRQILTQKFRSLVEPMLGQAAATELLSAIVELDRFDSVEPLLAFADQRESRS
jgi:2-methylcitrate dehydratase PrpD